MSNHFNGLHCPFKGIAFKHYIYCTKAKIYIYIIKYVYGENYLANLNIITINKVISLTFNKKEML